VVAECVDLDGDHSHSMSVGGSLLQGLHQAENDGKSVWPHGDSQILYSYRQPRL